MTLGTGLETHVGDLAALMSAEEDRQVASSTSGNIEADPSFQLTVSADPSEGVNYAGGSNYSDDISLDHSMSGLAGMLGAGAEGSNEVREALCNNLGAVRGLQGIFDRIEQSDRYLLRTAGKPWPNVRRGAAIDRGVLSPTSYVKKGSIYSGWNAAAQPGASAGVMSTAPGYRDINAGPGSYAEAMNYSPSPLAEQAGSLMGFADVSTRNASPGMKKILDAAKKPGTEQAAQVARELLKQSVKLGDTTAKRGEVMQRARAKYQSLLREVINLDAAAQTLANKLFDDNGEPHDDVKPSDIRKLKELRQKAFKRGREAIRYQKTNVVATSLTKNGYAQSELLQQMAMTLMTDQPRTTAVLASQFEKIGQESAAMRAQREAQVAKWRAQSVKEKGLGDFTLPERAAVTADYWEAELAGIEAVEMSYLGALEWGIFKKVSRGFKKAAKGVSRSVKKAGRSVSRGVKSVARTASRAADKTAKQVSRAAKRVGTQAARVAAVAAKRAAKYTTPITRTIKAVSKPIGRSIRAGARVAMEPVKMTYNVGRYAAQGDFGRAARSIARSVKNTARGVAEAAAASSIGLQCAFEKTPIGKAVAQRAGQAAGAFYGGAAGGAVGKEAGDKANATARGVCSGMDRVGITRGTFRPSQVKGAIRQTANHIYKKTLDPKALLKSATNIGMNYAAGGGSGIDMSSIKQFASKAGDLSVDQIKNLVQREGEKQLSPENIQRMVKKHGRKFVEAEVQRRINKNPALRKLSRMGPVADAIMQGTGAFKGGKVDLQKLQRSIERQSTRAIQAEAQKRAQRFIHKNAPQAAGAMQAAQQAAQVRSMSPAQRKAFIARQRETFLAKAAQTAQKRAQNLIRKNAPQASTAARAAQYAMAPSQRKALLARKQQALRARGVREAQRRAAGFI